MAKLSEPLAKAEKEMQELKSKLAKAKHDYEKTEQTERNAHIEARNAKEAAPFVDGPNRLFYKPRLIGWLYNMVDEVRIICSAIRNIRDDVGVAYDIHEQMLHIQTPG